MATCRLLINGCPFECHNACMTTDEVVKNHGSLESYATALFELHQKGGITYGDYNRAVNAYRKLLYPPRTVWDHVLEEGL